MSIEQSVLPRILVSPLEALDLLLDHERSFRYTIKDSEQGTGRLPEFSIKGQTWSEYAQDIWRKEQRPVKILEIGAAEDAAAWTGGLRGSQQNPEVVKLREAGVPLEITSHSYSDRLKEWTQENGVDRFIGGHMYDLLQYFQGIGEEFDLVLSNFALYHTCAVYECLPLIDSILADNGRAYLNTVFKSHGDNKALIFPGKITDWNGAVLLSLDDVMQSMNLAELNIPGLTVVKSGFGGEMNDVGWEKGDFDYQQIPSLAGYGIIENKIIGPTDRLIYTTG